jgi:hypothetical protein
MLNRLGIRNPRRPSAVVACLMRQQADSRLKELQEYGTSLTMLVGIGLGRTSLDAFTRMLDSTFPAITLSPRRHRLGRDVRRSLFDYLVAGLELG